MAEFTEWLSSDRFKKFKLIATAGITKELAESFILQAEVDFSAHASWIYDEVVMRVVQKVYGRELERQEHEYPRDWWQAFKARWFPAWAKNKWPVEMTRVVIVARELYPNVAFPEKSPIIAISKNMY